MIRCRAHPGVNYLLPTRRNSNRPENGNYWASVHYAPDSAAASNAPYTVTYNGGSRAFTVNEQSGTGGQWAVIAQEPFAVGTAGKVVAGDGSATASTRVEADEIRFAINRVTVNPNADNIWDAIPVWNIVQSWVGGASANDGFVVKAQDESALNVGGPRYEASFNAYSGETVAYPQLVVTYGNPGKNLAKYQVHRSVFQSFTPAANTLIATVPTGTTSFTDITNTPTSPGGLGNAFYYMVAVKTTDGMIIPGPVQLVRLPTAGSTVQIVDATGATSLSPSQPTTVEQHITGQPWTSVG